MPESTHRQPPDGARPFSDFTRIMHRGVPLAVHLRYTDSDFGSSGQYMAETFGHMPAYLCVLQLHDYPACNAWRDGRHFAAPPLGIDSFLLLDLRHAWQTEVLSPFDNIHLNVTQATLDELAEECGAGAVELNGFSYETFYDETLRHLALSLRPAFQRPREINGLFAEHVSAAAALHLIQTCSTYAGLVLRAGRLAPWQERRARDYINNHIDTDIDLAVLARTCGLSPTHFAKAFKRTTGLPPHRWLLQRRVERVCELLLKTNDPLEAIALACGFADQSHMTRVFTRAIGTPPGAWRRARRS